MIETNFVVTLEKLADLFPSSLSMRQREILAYQMLGYTQEEVALVMGISVSTVELDMQKARAEMNIEKTRDAYLIALRQL